MMDFQRNPSLLPRFLFSFALKVLVLIQLPHASSNPEEFYQTCGNKFSCGDINGVGYPFRGANDPPYCGYPGLVLSCDGDNVARIEIKNMMYRVLSVYPDNQTIRIAREDVMKATCPSDFLVNTTLDYTLFDYASSSINLTFLYGCPFSFNVPGQNFHSCGTGNNSVVVLRQLPGAPVPGGCNATVIYPVVLMDTGAGEALNLTGLDQILRHGFDVRWKVDGSACSDCIWSNGRCGYDMNRNTSTCFCPAPPYLTTTCSMGNGGAPSRGLSSNQFAQLGCYPSTQASLKLGAQAAMVIRLWQKSLRLACRRTSRFELRLL